MFEAFLYIAAIVAVLAFVGSPATTATVAPTEAQPEPQPIEVKPEPQPIAQPAPAMAATITEPVVSVTIRTEGSTATEAPATDYQAMTSAQLRKICTAAGIRWRNVHGTRHLTKGEMIAALAK